MSTVYRCPHCRDGLLTDEGHGWGECSTCGYEIDVETPTSADEVRMLGVSRPKCPNADHDGCSGPTGVHTPMTCASCGTATHANTCWQDGKRVPVETPVRCAACAPQGVLL
jgi:DNA-directed RNA polymerase subunit M/transcription elongation factor TFIIS